MATMEDVTASQSNATTTPSFDWPTTIASGDVLAIAIAQREASSTASVTAVPAGFTQKEIHAQNFSHGIQLWEYVADGTETGTFSVTCATTGRAMCVIARYSGAASINVSDIGEAFNFDTTHTLPTITTLEDAAQVGMFMAQADPDESPWLAGVPAGSSTALGATNTGPNALALMFSGFEEATAGATGTQAWTVESQLSVGVIFSIENSAGGGGSQVITRLAGPGGMVGPGGLVGPGLA